MNLINEPKLLLQNYLLGLVEPKDGIGNSLYLYGIGNFVKEIWNEITYMNRLKRKKILKELQIHGSPFYAIMKDKRGMSIQQLYKLLCIWKISCNKSDLELKNRWDQIYNSGFSIASFSKSIKVKLPKFITPKLSYLIGWIVGDGCFDSSNNKERLKISEKNREQLEKIIKPAVEEIFGIQCYIRKDNPGPCLRIFSKPVYRFFRKILKIEVGKIPKLVRNMDNVNRSFFIRGIFDSEGDVDSDYLRGRVRISQNSRIFLEEIILLLKSVDISANGPYGPNYGSKNGICYNIEIRKKSEIFKFAKKINSSHLDKFPRIEILSEKIRNKYIYFQKLQNELN